MCPWGTAGIGASRRTFPNPLLPPTPTPTNTNTNNNTNVNPSFLNPTLLLSLCLNERKALWVGNALHQTLRGESYRGEHERRSVRGRKSGVEAQCVWWGSVKVGVIN